MDVREVSQVNSQVATNKGKEHDKVSFLSHSSHPKVLNTRFNFSGSF